MNEHDQFLEEIRQEIRSASDELKAEHSTACLQRLVNAFFMLTQFLEEQYLE